MYEDGVLRRKALINSGEIVRIRSAVAKPGKDDVFIFRFESKDKKKEIKQSWRELLKKEWIVSICD